MKKASQPAKDLNASVPVNRPLKIFINSNDTKINY